MLFFPEACDYLCDSKKDTLDSAEPLLAGDTVRNYRKLAAKYNVWLSIGGVHERVKKLLFFFKIPQLFFFGCYMYT